jgi:hypothetical protein
MKKLMLAALLCVAVFVAAPAASASAESLRGVCAIQGTAEFTAPLKGGLGAALTQLTYTFKSEVKHGVPGVVCAEAAGKPAAEKAVADLKEAEEDLAASDTTGAAEDVNLAIAELETLAPKGEAANDLTAAAVALTKVEVELAIHEVFEALEDLTPVVKTGTATVKGEGEFSCLGKATFKNLEEEEGYGTLEPQGASAIPFELDLEETNLGQVALKIEKEGPKDPADTGGAEDEEATPEAVGTASFAASQNEEAKKCLKLGESVEKLEFQAVVAGELG